MTTEPVWSQKLEPGQTATIPMDRSDRAWRIVNTSSGPGYVMLFDRAEGEPGRRPVGRLYSISVQVTRGMAVEYYQASYGYRADEPSWGEIGAER